MVRTQRNFRIESFVAAVVVGAGAVLGIDRVEWLAIVLTIALVLILEAMNTALEHAVTLASPAFDAHARAAKDVSAAAVLIAAIASIAVGAIVFAPRVLR